MKVLVICYEYVDRVVGCGDLPEKLKRFYLLNSRGKLNIDLTKISMKVPFRCIQCTQAVEWVKDQVPRGFDVRVHFCRPKVSHAGRRDVITATNYVNVVHEFGHALGLSHANTRLGLESKSSKDQFDCMTSFFPYASLNSVHLFQLGWFELGELVNFQVGRYELSPMKEFGNKKLKVVRNGKYFLSYCEGQLVVHQIVGTNSSFLVRLSKKSMKDSDLEIEAVKLGKTAIIDIKSFFGSGIPVSD